MERALLQGERQAELEQMETETEVIAQLQHKLDELESTIQKEKDKVDMETSAELLELAHYLLYLFTTQIKTWIDMKIPEEKQ